MAINESLRLNTVATFSTGLILTEDTYLGKYLIKKDD